MVAKQHFVEWFSGSTIDSIWTQVDNTGTGTFSMVDAIDEGFGVISGTNTSDDSILTMNNIQHYDNQNSVYIAVVRRVSALMGANWGVYGNDPTLPNREAAFLLDDTTRTNKSLHTASNVSAGDTQGSVPSDTNFTTVKLVLSSANVTMDINGVFDVTRTTTLPTIAMTPFVNRAFARSTGGRESRVRYMEVYNI